MARASETTKMIEVTITNESVRILLLISLYVVRFVVWRQHLDVCGHRRSWNRYTYSHSSLDSDELRSRSGAFYRHARWWYQQLLSDTISAPYTAQGKKGSYTALPPFAVSPLAGPIAVAPSPACAAIICSPVRREDCVPDYCQKFHVIVICSYLIASGSSWCGICRRLKHASIYHICGIIYVICKGSSRWYCIKIAGYWRCLLGPRYKDKDILMFFSPS